MRAKALERLPALLRIAEDERCPPGERNAARARADAIIDRWELTPDEVAASRLADERAREPALLAAKREQRERMAAIHEQQRRAAMAYANGGVAIFVTGAAGVKVNAGTFTVEFS